MMAVRAIIFVFLRGSARSKADTACQCEKGKDEFFHKSLLESFAYIYHRPDLFHIKLCEHYFFAFLFPEGRSDLGPLENRFSRISLEAFLAFFFLAWIAPFAMAIPIVKSELLAVFQQL